MVDLKTPIDGDCKCKPKSRFITPYRASQIKPRKQSRNITGACSADTSLNSCTAKSEKNTVKSEKNEKEVNSTACVDSVRFFFTKYTF